MAFADAFQLSVNAVACPEEPFDGDKGTGDAGTATVVKLQMPDQALLPDELVA